MNENEINYCCLKSHPLFDSLPDSQLQLLGAVSTVKKYRRGDFIYLTGEQLNRIVLLVKGRVKIAYYDESDTEIVTELLKEGGLFGDVTMSEVSSGTQDFAQSLTEETTVCSIPVRDFETLLRNTPSLAVAYAKIMGSKLTSIRAKYSDVVLKDVRTRIVEFFISYALSEGVRNAKGMTTIQSFLTHQDIANITAASRQTVTSIINQLASENKLWYEGRKRIFIPDIKALH